MDAALLEQPRDRRFDLPDRGGVMTAMEMGPREQPVDIVFCHANGFNALTYRSILEPLARDCRILAINMRGHGTCELPAQVEGRTSWLDLRDDLVALLNVLAEPPVVVAGHSMGGATGLMAEAIVPSRVRSLVLFDPVIMPKGSRPGPDSAEIGASPLVQGALKRRAVFPSREAALEAYRGRGAFRTWSEEQLADYVAGGFRDRPDGDVELACAPQWEASNFSSHTHDAWGAFFTGRAPIRIFRAEHGSTCRIDGHEDELLATGRVRLEMVPDSSHFLPMERPDLVRDALREAVSQR